MYAIRAIVDEKITRWGSNILRKKLKKIERIKKHKFMRKNSQICKEKNKFVRKKQILRKNRFAGKKCTNL